MLSFERNNQRYKHVAAIPFLSDRRTSKYFFQKKTKNPVYNSQSIEWRFESK